MILDPSFELGVVSQLLDSPSNLWHFILIIIIIIIVLN